MKPLFIAAAAMLTGCATDAGRAMDEMEATLASAEIGYNACVASLNASEVGRLAATTLTLAGQSQSAGLTMDTSRVSDESVDALAKYVTREFDCFTSGVQAVEGVEQASMDSVLRAYGHTLRSGIDFLRANPGQATRAGVNDYFVTARGLREDASLGLYSDAYGELAAVDAAERQRRSDALGSLGASMQSLGQPPAISPSTPAGMSGCFLRDTIRTGATSQCVYSCLGVQRIQTIDGGICPL